jgi:hypothetical protein
MFSNCNVPCLMTLNEHFASQSKGKTPFLRAIYPKGKTPILAKFFLFLLFVFTTLGPFTGITWCETVVDSCLTSLSLESAVDEVPGEEGTGEMPFFLDSNHFEIAYNRVFIRIVECRTNKHHNKERKESVGVKD